MEALQREEVLIEASELMELMGQDGVRIFDATLLMNRKEGQPDARAVYESGHIPGAAFLDHHKVSNPDSDYYLMLPNAEALGQALGDLGIDADSEVIVYSSGMLIWATRIWWLLRYAGHAKVRVLNGGLAAFQEAGGVLETGISEYAPAQFQVSIQPNYFINAEEMQATINDSETTAVHSLPEETFNQGHIPGSVCQAFTDFLEGEGTLLPNSELSERLLKRTERGRTVTYCGGGIAATLNAIVNRLVGNPDVVVYDGSMSEWVGEGLPTDSTP